MAQRIRVVVAKPGLDGHDRGAKVIASAFRDGGFEVIYTGVRQTPEKIVSVILQEDADVLAVSLLSGAHKPLCTKIMELLKEKGVDNILFLLGGIIPTKDVEFLKGIGVDEVFGPGSDTNKIIEYIKTHVRKENLSL